jgi:hypothetical protein
MPAQAVLYNRVAQPMFSFGAGPYNSVVWSPHGRFVCLGGFGNLVCSLLAFLVQKYKCQQAQCCRLANMRFWDASLRQFTCFIYWYKSTNTGSLETACQAGIIGSGDASLRLPIGSSVLALLALLVQRFRY